MDLNVQFILFCTLIFIFSFGASRSLLLAVIIGLVFLVPVLPLTYGVSLPVFLAAAIASGVSIICLIAAKRKGLFILENSQEFKKWRVITRPFAMLFIPINLYAGHTFLLYLLGILSIGFILLDLYRLFTGHKMALFFKRKELKRFSSMTSFVVAIFIVFLIFPEWVAYLCLAFITLGDMAGKLIGMKFGKIMLIHRRTLAGSLGFLTGSLFAGYILVLIFEIDPLRMVTGAVCATLSELFSFSLDDNFTVSILTGACLVALNYFNVF